LQILVTCMYTCLQDYNLVLQCGCIIITAIN
jgi:hypothetical protein